MAAILVAAVLIVCTVLAKQGGGVPTDCKVSVWRGWGVCSDECAGLKCRHRIIRKEAQFGGKACPSLEMCRCVVPTFQLI